MTVSPALRTISEVSKGSVDRKTLITGMAWPHGSDSERGKDVKNSGEVEGSSSYGTVHSWYRSES